MDVLYLHLQARAWLLRFLQQAFCRAKIMMADLWAFFVILVNVSAA
jgi:hypothetical protein